MLGDIEILEASIFFKKFDCEYYLKYLLIVKSFSFIFWGFLCNNLRISLRICFCFCFFN